MVKGSIKKSLNVETPKNYKSAVFTHFRHRFFFFDTADMKTDYRGC